MHFAIKLQFVSPLIPDSIKEIIRKDLANTRKTSWNHYSEYIQIKVILKLDSQTVTYDIFKDSFLKAKANTCKIPEHAV